MVSNGVLFTFSWFKPYESNGQAFIETNKMVISTPVMATQLIHRPFWVKTGVAIFEKLFLITIHMIIENDDYVI